MATVHRLAEPRNISMPVKALWLAALTLFSTLSACATMQNGSAAAQPLADEVAVSTTLDTLYRAFCFDAHAEPDWETQRGLFAEGAAFAAPFGSGDTPRAVNAEQFITDFRKHVQTSPRGKTGYHESIVHAQIQVFGTIAHAFVVFDGFVPGDAPDARGVDSIQLVRGPEGWMVASFTTQYESADTPLPKSFLPH